MRGQAALDYLRSLCGGGNSVGRGARLRRALMAVSIPVSAGLATACYGVPPMEGDIWVEASCTDTVDDDADGLADCDDPDCAGLEVCIGCFDGVDNDGDGLADCSDASCRASEACAGCENSIDDDADGLTDCEDPECADTGGCA